MLSNCFGLITICLRSISAKHTALFQFIQTIIQLPASNGNFMAISTSLCSKICAYCLKLKARRKFSTLLYNLSDIWWSGEDSQRSLFTFMTFLVIGTSQEQCQLTYNTLLQLLINLGFSISQHKVLPPSQRLTFLGVHLNKSTCTVTLPLDKLVELQDLVIEFQNKQQGSKKQLQHLAGKLNWACCSAQS